MFDEDLNRKPFEGPKGSFMKQIIIVLFLISMPFTSFCGAVTILTTQNSPPTSLVIDGKLTGLAVEFTKAMQNAIGHKGVIKAQPGKRIIKQALKKPDILVFSLSRNQDRENKFHWIAHLTTRRTEFWAKKEFSGLIQSLADAKEVAWIGVTRGGNREKLLRDKGFINLDQGTNELVNLKKLLAGRVSLILLSTVEAASLTHQLDAPLSAIKPVYTVFENDSWIAMSKNGTSKETVNRWKAAAEKLKKDGTFEKIALEWVDYLSDTVAAQTMVKNNVLYLWKE